MQKLVALEEIKGLMSGIVYAKKYDSVEQTIIRDGVSQYKNLLTGELFDARNEKVGIVDINKSEIKAEIVSQNFKKLTPKQQQQLELYQQMMKTK